MRVVIDRAETLVNGLGAFMRTGMGIVGRHQTHQRADIESELGKQKRCRFIKVMRGHFE